jgi:N-acetyl-anhydromuramyl-L-alanine amidase AmpD
VEEDANEKLTKTVDAKARALKARTAKFKLKKKVNSLQI